MKNVKISLQSVLFILYSAVLLVLLIMPHYKYSISYKELFVLTLPFVVVYVFKFYGLMNKIKWMLFSLIMMIVFRLCINTWMNLSAAVNLSFILYLCMVSYFILEATVKRGNRNEMVIIVVILSFLIIFIAVNTFKEFATNPTVARMLAYGTTEDENINILRSNNIGGFGYSYAVGIFAPYLAVRLMKTRGWKKSVFGLLLIVDIVFCVYTQYMTLILFVVFFVGYVFSTRIKKVGIRFGVVFVMGILLLNIKNIFYFVGENLELTTLSSHLLDLVSLLNGEGTSSGRGHLYREAFKLFLQNPILGADLLKEANLNIINQSHSTLFPVLASGGIIGFILYYGVLFNMIVNIKRMVKTFHDIKPIYYMLIALSIVNPITHFEIMAVSMLLIPLLEIIRNDRNELEILHYE